jgi:hypothetical protein
MNDEVHLGFDWTRPSSGQRQMIEAKEIIDKLCYAHRRIF